MTGPDTLRVESFEAFYRRAWNPVHRAVAVGTGSSDLASDATEEAMVRAYERWNKVSNMENPEGWVYVTAINWARSRLRRRKFWSEAPVPEIAVDDPETPDPKTIEAIRHLPRQQREAVIARYLLDLSEAQMAEAFRIPKGTVKSRLNRALTTLRKELS